VNDVGDLGSGNELTVSRHPAGRGVTFFLSREKFPIVIRRGERKSANHYPVHFLQGQMNE
jgi:hypothetical protein